MAYIYKKMIGGREYYYLRASVQRGKKLLTKDLAYLGSDLDQVREALRKIPPATIRKTYKTIQRYLESNTFLEQARALKMKASPYVDRTLLEQVEACRLHWQKVTKKRDEKTQEDYLKMFVVDFTFNTTSIEGNTITLREAARLLTEHVTPKNKTLREIHDIQNTEKIFLEITKGSLVLTHESIIDLHKRLMDNIDWRIGYRTADVHVVNAQFSSTPAVYVRADMDVLLRWYAKHQDMHPMILAGITHHKFEKIHPFFDGNGRAGRMLMNTILLDKGYPPLIVRKKRRAEYLDALGKADKAALTQASPESYKPLMEFLASEIIDGYWSMFL